MSASSVSICSICPSYCGSELSTGRKVLVTVTVATFIFGLIAFSQFSSFEHIVKWLKENPALSGAIVGAVLTVAMPTLLWLTLIPSKEEVKNLSPIDEDILEKGGALAKVINFYWTERTPAQRAFLLTLIINIMALSILAQCHIQPIEGIREGFKILVEEMDMSAFALLGLVIIYFLSTLTIYFQKHTKFTQ